MIPEQGPEKAIVFEENQEEGMSPSKREMNKLWLIVRKVQSYQHQSELSEENK